MYQKEDIIKKVKEIVGRYDAQSVLTDENIDMIEVYDLSKVQIAMEIERVFGVEFDLGDITKVRTISDLVKVIEEQNS